METDGQGGQDVPAPADEPQELPTVHPGHFARHLPAAAAHQQQIRGEHGGAEQRGVLQGVHREPDAQVQAGHQALQGGPREDVRRELALQAQPHQAQPGLQSHAQRTQGPLPRRHLRRGPVPHHQERRSRLLEELLRRKVNTPNPFPVETRQHLLPSALT